jgi:hypothetical protein
VSSASTSQFLSIDVDVDVEVKIKVTTVTTVSPHDETYVVLVHLIIFGETFSAVQCAATT